MSEHELEPYARLIGWIVLTATDLEEHWREVGGFLHRGDRPTHRSIKTGAFSFSRLAGVVERRSAEVLSPELHDELADILDSSRALMRKRNRVVHDLWIPMGPHGPEPVVRISLREGTDIPASEQELKALYYALLACDSNLEEIHRKMLRSNNTGAPETAGIYQPRSPSLLPRSNSAAITPR